MRQQIIDTLEKQKGTFTIAFKDLSTGKELLINEQENFHAASTMKTPVMIEVFKQVAEGKLSLDDSVLIKNEFKSIVDSSVYSLDSADDSESEIYRHIGEKRTIYDLMYQMIIASSNLSTNLIIDLVDAKKVTQTMREMGAKKINILRGVEDEKAYQEGLNNTTTAYDLMLIFEKIAEGKAVNKKSSDAMIKILLNQEHNSIIPAELPKDVKVAHKTGSITGVHHDSGIVFLPNGRKYVLVLLSKNLEDDNAAVKAMADVSKMIYDFVTR
ncbi:MAG TPA: serine hydrolase [Hanamia sp.]|nr:serine hydrolase [Hanamia sp.]